MHSMTRGRFAVMALAVGVVFLGVEVIEALFASQTITGPLRFAALHTIGVVVFGILSILAVIAAVVLSHRWLIVLIAAVIAAAAVAVLLV